MQTNQEKTAKSKDSQGFRAVVAAERELADAILKHGERSAQSRTARERLAQVSVFSGSCIDPS